MASRHINHECPRAVQYRSFPLLSADLPPSYRARREAEVAILVSVFSAKADATIDARDLKYVTASVRRHGEIEC